MTTAAMSQDVSDETDQASTDPVDADQASTDQAADRPVQRASAPAAEQAVGSSQLPMPLVLPPALRRIVLTGFMGAGKSTVGRLVAERLRWRFVDIDLEIEAKAGMAPAEIFAKLGEFVFRRMETSAIAHALGERHTIIALGGGAPEVLANRLLLEQTPQTAIVLLHAPFSLLVQRAFDQEAADRPNLRDLHAAEERYRYRAPLYRRCARYTINTEDLRPEETADALLRALCG